MSYIPARGERFLTQEDADTFLSFGAQGNPHLVRKCATILFAGLHTHKVRIPILMISP
jgi:hypothetical protein